LHPDSQVTFVGTSRGVEAKAVPAAGFAFRPIEARGFPRRPTPEAIGALWSFGRGFMQMAGIIKEVKPHVILATGGYVSGPAAIWARLLSIPLVLQEQNSVPGAANRWLSLIASQVHISFVESRNYFRRKNHLKVTGNPTRRTLLLFGGSRGAASINRAVAGALPLLARMPSFQVLWQTGSEDEAAMKEASRTAP